VSLKPNTWFSIELQATTPLREWSNQPVRSAQEEDAELGADGQMHWILRRQTEFTWCDRCNELISCYSGFSGISN